MNLQDLDLSIYRRKLELGCLENGRENGLEWCNWSQKKGHVQGVICHLGKSHVACLGV